MAQHVQSGGDSPLWVSTIPCLLICMYCSPCPVSTAWKWTPREWWSTRLADHVMSMTESTGARLPYRPELALSIGRRRWPLVSSPEPCLVLSHSCHLPVLAKPWKWWLRREGKERQPPAPDPVKFLIIRKPRAAGSVEQVWVPRWGKDGRAGLVQDFYGSDKKRARGCAPAVESLRELFNTDIAPCEDEWQESCP